MLRHIKLAVLIALTALTQSAHCSEKAPQIPSEKMVNDLTWAWEVNKQTIQDKEKALAEEENTQKLMVYMRVPIMIGCALVCHPYTLAAGAAVAVLPPKALMVGGFIAAAVTATPTIENNNNMIYPHTINSRHLCHGYDHTYGMGELLATAAQDMENNISDYMPFDIVWRSRRIAKQREIIARDKQQNLDLETRLNNLKARIAEQQAIASAPLMPQHKQTYRFELPLC